MKPKILVLYYTQTGQMQQVLESIVSGMDGQAEVDGVAIEPVQPYPFPWSTASFFDALPASMAHTPVTIKPVHAYILNKEYDLIILGYQPWFLNPSLPISTFLQSEYAQLLKNKPVVTVIGCRKMWLHAQEKVKEYLHTHNSRLVGNIVLKDRAPGPISVVTAARWSFKGKKEATDLLPSAGISADDVAAAKRFGAPICKHLIADNLIGLQQSLLALGAIRLNTALVATEQRRIKHYRWGAKYIQGKNDTGRAKRIKLFKNIIVVGYIVWPAFLLLTLLKLLLKGPELQKDREYFRQLQYENGRI